MSNPRHALGRAAEEAVARWLTGAGWTILARRVRVGGGGEVDLIGLDPARTLVAVEVRARRTDRTGPAGTTVDRRRIHRLTSTLVAYASASAVGHGGLRVDLVAVEPMPAARDGWRLRRTPDVGAR
jgi:putative endonuclease